MAKGIYRDNAGWVQVDYDSKYRMLMKKSDYEDHDYKPRYEALPTKQKYEQGGTVNKSSPAGINGGARRSVNQSASRHRKSKGRS